MGGQRHHCARTSVAAQATTLKALIFNGEGSVVNGEELRRQSYNAAFKQYKVQYGDADGGGGGLEWTPEDFASVSMGGAEPSMRSYFGRSGWPSSSLFEGRAPSNEQERTALLDALQHSSIEARRGIISSGDVHVRPGVLRVMDEARSAGVAVSVCCGGIPRSDASGMLGGLLGGERLGALACVLGREDLAGGKPGPDMYKAAASLLGADPSECVVIEHSLAGLQAATAAGMRCVVTYAPSTKWQEFPGAERIVSDLESGEVTVRELQQRRIVQDDRINMTVTDSGVFWSKAGGW